LQVRPPLPPATPEGLRDKHIKIYPRFQYVTLKNETATVKKSAVMFMRLNEIFERHIGL